MYSINLTIRETNIKHITQTYTHRKRIKNK